MGPAMQKSHFLTASTMLAAIALSACNSEPETINKYDAQAEALEKAQPVARPPMILASRTFRCNDNALVYVDFFDNNTAVVRTEQGGMPVASLNAPSADGPFTADGYSVSANSTNITFVAPGKGSRTCHT